ncbi:MAG: hypothetical protein U0836_16745 [Pirellulales bacterium]
MKEALEHGSPVSEALQKAIGGTEACHGLWRFYSDSWPSGGTRHWNTDSRWKQQWEAFLPQRAFAFGEDVFGNQLIVVPGEVDVFLWNHENGECTDLYSDPVGLLTTALQDGIGWIDLYGDGSLAVARRFGPVARESHLHWTTPLFLGGAVNDSNISVVEREAHLAGHAKLWSQVRSPPP